MNPGEPPGAGVGHPATGVQPAPKRAGAAAICKNEGNRASSHLREIRFMKGILANPKPHGFQKSFRERVPARTFLGASGNPRVRDSYNQLS